MKITSPWRRNNNTNKKKRFTSKPKIAWQRLGLTNRKAAEISMSIDEIRRQVILASNLALGQSVPSDPPGEGARPSEGSTKAALSRKPRREATK